MPLARRTLHRGVAVAVAEVVGRPAAGDGLEAVSGPEAPVLAIPLGGVFTLHEADGRTRTLTVGDAAWVDARPYEVQYPRGVGDRCLTIQLRDGPGFGGTPAGVLRLTAAEHVCAVMFARLARDGSLPAARLDGASLHVLRVLMRRLAGPTVAAPGRPQPAVRAVKEEVGADPGAPWSLPALARCASISPSRLAHVFGDATGVSVHRFVIDTRLAAGLSRVVETDEALARIAADLGFASHSHFTALFHRRFSLTPTELRRSLAPPTRT